MGPQDPQRRSQDEARTSRLASRSAAARYSHLLFRLEGVKGRHIAHSLRAALVLPSGLRCLGRLTHILQYHHLCTTDTLRSTTPSRALGRLEIISPEESSEARNQPGRVFRGLKSARKGSGASNHAEGVARYLVGSAVVAGELAFHVVSAVLHPLVVLELLPPQHLAPTAAAA